MAGEVLKTASELLVEDLPNNSAGLITPVNQRSVVVSVLTAVGFLEDDPAQTPYVIPMTDGVPVDFNSTLVAPLFVGNYWAIDGNNAFVPNYVAQGVTVKPGTTRLVSGSVLLTCQKLGGGTGLYVFQGTENGVLTGDPVTREIGTTAELLTFAGTRLYDVSVGGPISFQITPQGTSDDLQINDVRIALEGKMV
jgi:hypothetical protein